MKNLPRMTLHTLYSVEVWAVIDGKWPKPLRAEIDLVSEELRGTEAPALFLYVKQSTSDSYVRNAPLMKPLGAGWLF